MVSVSAEMSIRRPVDGQAGLVLAVLCALWGTQQVAIKLAAPDMAPVLQVGIRSGLAAAIVLIVVLHRREGKALGNGNWRPGILAGALFGVEFVLFGEGLRFTSASHMSIFLYTAPVFAAFGLHLLLPEERLSPVQWIGMAVAFSGIVVSFSGRGGSAAAESAWIGDILGIAAGALWGATTLVVRTTRLARAPAAVTLWYQLLGGCLIGMAAALWLGDVEATASTTLVASLAYQTVVLSTVSYLAWFAMLRQYLASRLGVLTLMTPVFGMAFGVAVLGDELTAQFLSGAALILSGILLVSGREFVRRHPRNVSSHETSAESAR